MMVIFGAGASYDSLPSRLPSLYPRTNLRERPPLASELFLPEGICSEALRYFPQCRPIIPYLQAHDPSTTIEQRLETLQSESDQDEERKRQLAAVRWYLQFVISQFNIQWSEVSQGITNYVTLLDQLRRCRGSSPVLLVTFNYDRMIEEALSSLSISVSSLESYVKDDGFKLFKLHGSVNWGREIDTQVDAMKTENVWTVIYELINRAKELKISDRYRALDYTTRPVGLSESVPLFPAVAIPVETKRAFECPAEHLECLRNHLAAIRKILIVGWRGTEAHFLALLKDHLTNEVHVEAIVGDKDESEAVLAKIGNAGIKSVGTSSSRGFTDYVVRREAERFFS
jgi:hypothetical protein